MQTLYVTDNGVLLKKKSNRILLKKDNKILEEIPILDLKRVIIFGSNQVSTQLLQYFATKGIDVAFLSSSGRFKFRLIPETSKNIFLRMAQHDHYRNKSFRIQFSQNVIEAKIRNQRSLLVRYQRNRPEVDLKRYLEILKKCFHQVKQKQEIDEIMGVEGYAGKTYFEAYGKLLLGGFTFRKRVYHPPPDPINALLSFGYMLLFNEIESLLEGTGFDVFLGFVHSTHYGRASLATDLIEELRSPLIDRLVLYLINTSSISLKQFSPNNNGVFMDSTARKTFLSNYEKFMTTDFLNVQDKNRTNYRQIIRDQVIGLEKTLLQNVDYRCYLYY